MENNTQQSMDDLSSSDKRCRKRRKLNSTEEDTAKLERRKRIEESLAQPISPPPLRRANPSTQTPEAPMIIKSPFQLTWVRDLPESSNVDTVTLKDILGDPLIKECWNFNYLHDLEFLMDAFDEDVTNLVEVHVVHGFWKREDDSRLRLKSEAEKFPNLTLHSAFMPEMFGTHHSKMLIVLRHDDTAQVIIHTANMIPFDWTNMSQALWRSPLLPKITSSSNPSNTNDIGSGSRFKIDLLNYLKAYDGQRTICKPLVKELENYDFSEIHAALVASVPGKHDLELEPGETSWGWPALRNVLNSLPTGGKGPEIVVQISSIASLGANDKWLDQIFFKALGTAKNKVKSKFRIIFPTADEVRRSLNGYLSGKAIHTKIQSAAQVKQVQYLKPLLCHWAGDGAQQSSTSSEPILDGGRKRAAPHIKTYVKFGDSKRETMDWMLVTSANLSKQAWGEATNEAGEVRICSYEIGVMVWPALFGENAIMVPTFKTDTPQPSEKDVQVVIGARMPYDLPLVPYGKDDLPWCASASYTEPDWMGQTYNVA